LCRGANWPLRRRPRLRRNDQCHAWSTKGQSYWKIIGFNGGLMGFDGGLRVIPIYMANIGFTVTKLNGVLMDLMVILWGM